MSGKSESVAKEIFQKRSAADFFHDNKAMAGFDNSLRVVFTSVRELVENGLDAAEKIERLPEIDVKIEILEVEEIASLLKIDRYRKRKAHLDFIRLTVKDNGLGVPKKDVPDLFGRVLSGSNYGARQTRGRFGLGAKMVLLNAMASVDLPIRVKTRHFRQKITSEHHLFIDLQKNQPKIEFEATYRTSDEAFEESGTEVSVTFTGAWKLAKRYIREYFRYHSIITPYAQFNLSLPDEKPVLIERVVDEMPPHPKISKLHPWGCDITQLKREISNTKAKDLVSFLSAHFEGMTSKKAREFLEFVNLKPEQNPKSLKPPHIRRIVHDGFSFSQEMQPMKGEKMDKAERGFSFPRPSGEALSPLGEERLRRGLGKELNPDLIEVATSAVNAYAGHAFLVEAGLAYGGSQLGSEVEGTKTSSIRVFRFANRIPLLFGSGNDVISKVINDGNLIDWKAYKINLATAPIAIVVSIVSTKIPFPETSKEYIADVPALRHEIAEVLKTVAAKIRTHLTRRERAERERQRQSRFQKFAPHVSQALVEILSAQKSQPFELPHLEVLLASALSEGIPKTVGREMPSPPIREMDEWIDYPTPIQDALAEKGIVTIADFLIRSPASIAESGLTLRKIQEVKRASITELDSRKNVPRVSDLKIISSHLESNFEQFESLPKALSRRWISTVYDFLSAEPGQFSKVKGFPQKLWWQLKSECVEDLHSKGRFDDKNHRFSSLSWVNSNLKEEFASQGILTKPHFLNTFDKMLLNNRKFPQFMKYLISFIGNQLKTADIGPELLGSHEFDWFPKKMIRDLISKKIRSYQDLIDAVEGTPKIILGSRMLLSGVIIYLKRRIVVFE